jgi:hypothetical protein
MYSLKGEASIAGPPSRGLTLRHFSIRRSWSLARAVPSAS